MTDNTPPDKNALPSTVSPLPKRLSGDHRILLHTRFAQQLFLGSWAKKQTGLVQFAERIKKICWAAKSGDLAAQTYLTNLDQSFSDAHQKIQEWQMHYEKKRQAHSNIQLNLVENLQPVELPLRFATPQAFSGAYLIAATDDLIRLLLTLENAGLLLTTTRDTTYQVIADTLRTIFRSAFLPLNATSFPSTPNE